MWDERVVAAIVKAAREDLQQQKWARDFADKFKAKRHHNGTSPKNGKSSKFHYALLAQGAGCYRLLAS
jgi:hypothetical protein